MDILFGTWAATRATGWGPAKKNKKNKNGHTDADSLENHIPLLKCVGGGHR
jgi:hypothetical protein